MKVLMIKDVGGVGRRGEIKEVTDGYALNHLIARGLAQQATPDKIKAHAAQVQEQNAARDREEKELATKIESLDGVRIETSVRATDKGGLFKSLGVADIQKAVHDQRSIDIPAAAIELEKPIKEVGEQEIQLKTPGAKARLVFSIKKMD